MHPTQQSAVKSRSVARWDERTSTIIFAISPQIIPTRLSFKYPEISHCCLAALCQPSRVLSSASALDVFGREEGRQVRNNTTVARPFSSSQQSPVY